MVNPFPFCGMVTFSETPPTATGGEHGGWNQCSL
jgi:hypothetical protein